MCRKISTSSVTAIQEKKKKKKATKKKSNRTRRFCEHVKRCIGIGSYPQSLRTIQLQYIHVHEIKTNTRNVEKRKRLLYDKLYFLVRMMNAYIYIFFFFGWGTYFCRFLLLVQEYLFGCYVFHFVFFFGIIKFQWWITTMVNSIR